MAYSLWEMTRFTADIGIYEIVYTGVFQGVGLGFIFVPLSAAAFTTLPQRYRNEGPRCSASCATSAAASASRSS